MLIALLDDGIDLRRCPDIRLREDLSVQPDGRSVPAGPRKEFAPAMGRPVRKLSTNTRQRLNFVPWRSFSNRNCGPAQPSFWRRWTGAWKRRSLWSI